MKLNIVKAPQRHTQVKPSKPVYQATTTTPFEIINIAANIAKCAGYDGKLKMAQIQFYIRACNYTSWSQKLSTN